MLKSKGKYKKKLNIKAKPKKSKDLFGTLASLLKIFIFAIIVASFVWLYLNLGAIVNNWVLSSSNQVNRFLRDLGFSLETITVDGQNFTSNEEIGKKLKLRKHMPIFSVPLEQSKQDLEKLPWVKNVVVERDLPDTIHVYIQERVPLALGQKDRRLYVIDEDGEVINEKPLASQLSLPIIIGEGAEIYARDLIKMLKTDPELFKKISAIIRVSERRWNIRFDDEFEVKLPEENMEAAWKKVIKMNKAKQLFLPEVTAIDLRVANKIYVEKK